MWPRVEKGHGKKKIWGSQDLCRNAVDHIQNFDTDDQAAKHCSLSLNVLQLGDHYQKFEFHQQQEALASDFLAATFLHPGCFWLAFRNLLSGCMVY